MSLSLFLFLPLGPGVAVGGGGRERLGILVDFFWVRVIWLWW